MGIIKINYRHYVRKYCPRYWVPHIFLCLYPIGPPKLDVVIALIWLDDSYSGIFVVCFLSPSLGVKTLDATTWYCDVFSIWLVLLNRQFSNVRGVGSLRDKWVPNNRAGGALQSHKGSHNECLHIEEGTDGQWPFRYRNLRHCEW